MSAEMIALYGSIGAVLLGIVSFFLKQTMSKVDDHEKRVQSIEKNYATKPELEKTKKELAESTQRSNDDISFIRDHYLTKDDFYRSQADTNKKLDKMYDLMLEIAGERKNGQN